MNQNPAITADRLPPHSVEAEQGVIGSILLAPNDSLGVCIEKLKAGADAFYDLRHQCIYTALLALYDSCTPIDIISLQESLKSQQRLDEVGGLTYLNTLPDLTPSAANLSYWIDIVREKHLLRRMLRVCTESAALINEGAADTNTVLDQIERDVLAVRTERESEDGDQPIRSIVQGAIDRIEVRSQKGGRISGISTGLNYLDRLTDGLHGGEMTVVAAFPSIGKTSLAMNIVEHVIIDAKLPVAVFSLEMSAESLVERMIASRSRVNLRRIEDYGMTEGDFSKIIPTTNAIAAAKLFLVDKSLTILQLRAKARRLWQRHGVKLFVVDYLQLVESPTARGSQSTREQEVAAVSHGLKALARETGCPVLVLSQLNDDGKLRESRAIGQDADNLWVLEDASDDSSDAEGREADPVKLTIRKQRNGPRNVHADLVFLKGYTRFESAARVETEDSAPRHAKQPHND